MNIDEIIKELIKLQLEPDTEQAHRDADEYLCLLLVELGHEDVVNEFNKIEKWYA